MDNLGYETAIIGGMGIIAFLFAYIGFELRNSDEEFWKRTAVFTFFISLLFIVLLMATIFLMVDNNLPYLKDTVIIWALFVTVWFVALVSLIFLGALLWSSIKSLFDWLGQLGKKNE